MMHVWLRTGSLLVWGWLLTFASLSASEYRYSYIPKTIFKTQVFPVTILASDTNPSKPVTFQFDPKSKQKPLNFTPVKVVNNQNLFFTFYFQATGEDDVPIPRLLIRETNRTHTLPPRLVHTQELDTSNAENFCGIIATDCTVQSSQVSLFDTNTTLIAITIRAHEAHPEAIHIPNTIEQGIEKITRKDATVTAEYYFVIPSSQTSITLSYYNTVQRRFIATTLSTDYRSKPVAAQVELNPKASPFDKLKKYGSIALALFFALMFLWKRDWLYLILLIVVAFLIYIVYQPRATLCIREGSPLYILPTHNSRSSTTVTEDLHTRTLGERGTYHKINYRNGIIGWIRHEDLCQN
jgi:hypothetical protein